MKIENDPESYYLEDGCYKWTFRAKKVKKVVEKNCKGKILNLFAGKTKLNVEEVRVDLSNEFKPDYNMKAIDFLNLASQKNWKYDTIIYDPPWNQRKSKEFYNGNYIGVFTKLKNNIIEILNPKGITISVGYTLSNFGKIRGLQLTKYYDVNPFGEIRPYYIAIETKVKEIKLELHKEEKNSLKKYIT